MSSKAEERASQRAARLRNRLQLLLWMLEDWMIQEDSQGMVIDTITVRHGRDRGMEPLVVVKARFEGRAYVGFHSASDPEAAIVGALERIKNQQLKWREDTPYEPEG